MARWECGERLPSDGQVHALCFALGACLDEVVALTADPCADPPEREARTWEEMAREVAAFLHGPSSAGMNRLLGFHLLDERLWRWSLREERAPEWLLSVRLYHAFDHRVNLRWPLVEQMLDKAREAVPEGEMGLDTRLRYLILSARLSVHGGHRPAPARGVRLLQPWVEASRPLPALRAWILSEMAK